MAEPEQAVNYDEPVAYDKDGRPLYAHPPTETEKDSPPQVVHMSRAAEPAPLLINEEIKAKHDASVAKRPTVNLSEAEYIISEVSRHPIGLVPIVGTCILVIVMIFAGLLIYPGFVKQSGAQLPPPDTIILPSVLLIVLALLGGYIAVWVYINNKFILTNESVIQEIQTSLFSHHEQTVSLSNIEDASYRQVGFIQSFFNYGSIRLSTEGDETTYRFNYVSNPKNQIAILNNAVEAFKNGRPIEG
jgi:hypothetical protein